MNNMEAIKNNYNRYQEKFQEKFNKKATCWFSYLRWLADSNLGHTFQPNETKKAIELFESEV